jgi:ABC-type uncharacterized transport system ATPase subunit
MSESLGIKPTPALEMLGIRKRFGSILANNKVDFTVYKGEIHALLGENGAGKTTLMNILCGLYRADEGEIRLNGKQVHIHNPRDMINFGIGMVHQQFMLIRPFTVAENMVFGLDTGLGPLLELQSVEQRVEDLSSRYKLAVNPRARVEELSVGAQQRVEIIKALYRGAELLILDEPTAVLTPQEANELFQILRDLKAQGHTVIFISHKLDEVMDIADRITVLRDGSKMATVNRGETNKKDLARMMIGREVLFRLEKSPPNYGEVVLDVTGLTVLCDDGRPVLKDISFCLHAGEILGIAGIDGNGQTELAQILIGMRNADQGMIKLDGKDVTRSKLKERLKLGFGYIPEDRAADGLILSFSVCENVILDTHNELPYSRGLYLNGNEVLTNTKRLIGEFDVKTHGPHEKAGKLSGGNLQKLVLAREVDRDPRVLIASQPTRGLDVGATEYVRKRILEQRDKGRAILLISADLDEIKGLSDRIMVIYEGQIMGLVDADSAQIETLGLMMAGTKRMDLPMGEPEHG